MTNSAIIVQAWWRGLLVRQQLGPYKVVKKKGQVKEEKSGKKKKWVEHRFFTDAFIWFLLNTYLYVFLFIKCVYIDLQCISFIRFGSSSSSSLAYYSPLLDVSQRNFTLSLGSWISLELRSMHAFGISLKRQQLNSF